MMSSASRFPRRPVLLTQELDQLRSLLRLVAADNPFYTQKFEAGEVSYSIRHIGDMAESIPLTTRQELIADARANPPFGTNLSYAVSRYAHCHQWQDEAGLHWCWLDTAASWSAMAATGAEVFRAAEVGPEDRVFFLSSYEQQSGTWLPLESGALGGSLCFSAAGLDVQGRWEAIQRLGPTVVVGAAADFRALAEAAPAGVAGAQAPSVRLALGGGRPGEAEAVRVQAARLWPEARVWDYVALPETGVVAFECPARPGVMHLAEPAVFPEIVDPATGRSLDSGEGELVLTTLFRAGSPLVRYRTGCRAALCPDTACECGRHQLAVEGGIGALPAQPA